MLKKRLLWFAALVAVLVVVYATLFHESKSATYQIVVMHSGDPPPVAIRVDKGQCGEVGVFSGDKETGATGNCSVPVGVREISVSVVCPDANLPPASIRQAVPSGDSHAFFFARVCSLSKAEIEAGNQKQLTPSRWSYPSLPPEAYSFNLPKK
jgi:hypothetical protein